MSEHHTQVLVVGGGQAGLAAGYYLRRAKLDFAILDASTAPGGAWQHYWDSLRLFSPAAYSSLPGRAMPQQTGQTYPDAEHVTAYLADYEKRYELAVHRPVTVHAIESTADGRLLARTDSGTWHTRALSLRQLEAAGQRAGMSACRGTHAGRGRRSAGKIVRQQLA